jgi:cysteine synthase
VSGADLARVEAATRRITAERGAFRADQFGHAGNPAAHEFGTAAEIWAQSGHTLTAFCDFVGSGGTLGGVAKALGPKGVRCYAVEPAGAEALAGGATDRPGHPIQGGGYAMPDLAHLQTVALAGHLAVTGDDARTAARMLARVEGVFGGFSTGANLAAAMQLLKGPERGGTVAFVACDSGLKYLSTDLWPSQGQDRREQGPG